MKSKINFLCICIMLLCLSVSKDINAQQSQAKPTDLIRSQTDNGQPGTGYTYKVFQAPNNMFGYDIYQNGKRIFHQPAVMVPPNNVIANQRSVQENLPVANDQRSVPNGFSKNEFAENAALLSIEKIKKRSIPGLTNDEIKQVITSTNSATSIKH